MDGEGEEGDDQDDLAAEWEAMVGGVVSSVSGRETTRVLNQDEIDNLLGFDEEAEDVSDKFGIQAILNSAMVSYERLPMFEVVFDRLVRMMSTSLRNFTSDNYAGWIGGLSPA
jgi:flagellar motor switch protein FliM